MASTYSDLKIELIGTGEQSGTWGSTTNNNFSIALSEAITGSADVAFSSADVTVTLTNTNSAQTARNLRLNLTGTSGGARNLILGSGCQIEKFYLINNGLADAVTVKNTSGTGTIVPAGTAMLVFNNGTNVVNPLTYFTGTLVSSSATITGGTINGTSVGASTASTGAFTTLAASSNATVGGTLGVTGNATFTNDLAVNGNTTLGNASGDTITLNAATATIPNNLDFSGTGTIRLPNGTTGQRPSPTAGMIRYNTTEASFEGYAAGAWGSIGGGATGAGGDQVFYENELTVTADYTLTTSRNAMSTGPITINSGITVTVPTGQRWVIL
jgi:trimeric autotransporter adhesin